LVCPQRPKRPDKEAIATRPPSWDFSGLLVKTNSTRYKLRKWTVPAHWGFGVLLAVIAVLFFPASIVLLLVFAMFEWWNDWCEGSKDGCTDWWDSFFVYCGGLSVAVTLDLIGKIEIRWWF
jgi:opacity protein-like surface antigen